VVGSHIDLKLLDVGAGRRFPTRDLVDGIEVVREVLGLTMAYFPVGRKAAIVVFLGIIDGVSAMRWQGNW
jgi:hypothetical protein